MMKQTQIRSPKLVTLTKIKTLKTTYNLFIVSFLILSLVENDRSNLRSCFIGFLVQKVLKVKVFLFFFFQDALLLLHDFKGREWEGGY